MSRCMRLGRTIRGVAVLGSLTALGLIAPAPAPGLQLSTVRISGRSPVRAACGAVGNPMFTHNSAVEPDIEVDPGDADHVVAAWIQDDGSAIVTSTSTDGGRSWRHTVVGGLTRCTGGREAVTGDPWLSFGADHRLYLASGVGSIVSDPSVAGGYRIVTEQLVSRSTDTGRSWLRPSVTQPLTSARYDKQTVTADPRSRQRAYAVFCQRPSGSRQAGALYVSRTVDGGRHWSSRRLVYRSPIRGATPFSNGGVILYGHTVVLTFALLNPDGGTGGRVMTIRSTNQGTTWGRAVRLARVTDNVPGRSGPEPASNPIQPLIALLTLPAIAGDSRGRIYLTWTNLRPGGDSSVEIARSSDGGASWRRMRPITQTTAQPFGPRIAISRDGTIGVTYYEARRVRRHGSWRANVLFAYSRDGARHWRRTRLAGPTNLMSAEHPGGGRLDIRIGDYFGLAASGNTFLAADILAEPQAAVAPQNVFVTRIRLGRRAR